MPRETGGVDCQAADQPSPELDSSPDAVEDLAGDRWVAGRAAAGLRALAFGPIAHGDGPDGVLLIGTFDEAFARTIAERMPGAFSFSASLSALLGERMHARRVQRDLHDALEALITARPSTRVQHSGGAPDLERQGRGGVGFGAQTAASGRQITLITSVGADRRLRH